MAVVTRARRTLYSYVLTHFHSNGISTYVFKCANDNLKLTTTVKNKLLRNLEIKFNDTQQLELVKLETVRVEDL